MSLDGIDTIWASPANRTGRDAAERQSLLLALRLRRDRRRLTAILALAAVPLVAISTLLVVRLAGATGAPAEGWTLAPPLALSWLAFWRFARARRAHLDAHPAPERSIADALAAAADANRRSRSRVRWLVGLDLAAAPALVLALRGLATEGKVLPHELPSLAAVLAAMLLAAAGAALAWDRFHLRPEQRRLRALLECYT
jgi:hypothetical protein